MKTTTLIDRYKKENTETESQQKLITEFTPSTGIRLWVPLQWVPIQLFSLKWYKNGSRNNFSNCKQNAIQSLEDLSSGSYN